MAKKEAETKIEPGNIEKQKSTSNVVKNLLKQHRQRIALDEANKVPLSESAIPAADPPNFKRQDCIDLLRGIAENAPERVVSRNYFRVHSGIRESVWNQYFGTFHEFKRQSGIVLSRHVHKLEREIAKHASVDHYRALGEQRESWAEKHLVFNDSRIQRIITASDFHDVYTDPFALRVFLDTCRRIQPEIICICGDLYDLSEFSKFHVDPRDWNVVPKIKFVHEKILGPLRSSCPNSQIDLIEGNHELRLVKHFADRTDALKVLLKDLKGVDIEWLLGLQEFKVNYIGKADLGAWNKKDINSEVKRNFKVYFDAVLACHYSDAKSKGMPGFSGHNHKLEVWSHETIDRGSFQFWQMGCMCKRDASYTDGEKWNNGFLIIDVDTDTEDSNFQYVSIKDFARVEGITYFRTRQES